MKKRSVSLSQSRMLGSSQALLKIKKSAILKIKAHRRSKKNTYDVKELKYSFTRDDLIILPMKKGMPWASPSLDA